VARYFAGKGDLGGDLVKIVLTPAMQKTFEGTLSKNAPKELHAFWDDLPGEGQPGPALPEAESFAKVLPAAPVADVADTTPDDWAAESLKLAKKHAYASPIKKSPSPSTGSGYKITQAYYDRALQDAKDRIALAGARLAKLLTEHLQ